MLVKRHCTLRDGLRVSQKRVSLRERVAAVLKEKKWSAREWARRAGLKSETSVGHVLEGKTEALRAPSMAKLAKAAGVNIDWLTLGEGPKFPVETDLRAATIATWRAQALYDDQDPEEVDAFLREVSLDAYTGAPENPDGWRVFLTDAFRQWRRARKDGSPTGATGAREL